MIALAEALHQAFAGKWGPEEAQAIEDALDAAAEWQAGRLPLSDAAAVGEAANRDGVLASCARTQARAMLAASPADPRRAALAALLEALIDRQRGVVRTRQGCVPTEELWRFGVDPRALPIRFPGGDAQNRPVRVEDGANGSFQPPTPDRRS